jgi:PAS domain S-box-containing protein
MAEYAASSTASPAPATDERAWRGPRSIARALFVAMTVTALATSVVSYLVSVSGVTEVLETEERLRAARMATEVEQALAAEIRQLRAAASGLAASMEAAGWARRDSLAGDLAAMAHQARASSGVDAIQMRGADGRLLVYSSALTDLRPPKDAPAQGIAFEARGDGGWVGATVAVHSGGQVIARVSAERSLGHGFLRQVLGSSDLQVSLLTAERLLASTLPEPAAQAQLAAIDPAAGNSGSRFFELDGEVDLFVRPIMVDGQPLRVLVHVPEGTHAQIVGRLRNLALAGAALTLVLSLLAAAGLSRWIGQPLRNVTQRARVLSQRFAGGQVAPRAGEIDTLVASFDAMTSALLAHSERLKQAHEAEQQHGRQLQRQYAMMRLLRGVTSAAADSANMDSALRAVLHELGAFFEWPLGRVAILEGEGAGARPTRSLWLIRDEARFASFVETSNGRAVSPSVRNLIGRALLTGAPFWAEDLEQLSGWNRLEAARDCGLRSAFAIPVMASGHALAFIEFFSDRPAGAGAEIEELLATVTDELSRLAERHLAQRTLAASQAVVRRLALVAERTEKLFLLLDTRGRIEWANASVLRRFGRSMDDLRGASPYRLLDPSAADPRAAMLIGDAIVRGAPCQADLAAGGAHGVFEIEGRPLSDDNGVYVQYSLLCTDVTERRRAEAQARQSEQFFRVLFDESPVPMTIQDERFVTTRANAAYAAMLACPAEALVGQDLITRFHPDERDAVLARRQWILGCGRSPMPLAERRMVTGDGRTILTAGNSNAIVDPDGRRQWVSVVFDVTDARAKERALIEARDAAEQASRAKSQFLANMSHEIRTPMNGVLGMTELLLGTALSDKQRRFVEAAYRSGETLLEIINDMLDLSKIEAGRLELERAEFCLRVLVEDVFEMMAPRAQDKRLELACRIDPAVPAVLVGDAMRLRQVFANLVSNAIKFTERGQVLVVVDGEAFPDEPSKYRVRFEVRDTGIGIAPEALARLFTPFMQADQTMSRRYGGTGLGLTISRQLVEMMGGRIDVRSAPGQGSVFRFDVCLALGEASAETVAPAETLRGRHVLLVEDNPVNRGVLEGHLNAFGMHVASAVHGAQALELLRAAATAGRQFDLLVVDVKMPVMDGATLVQRLRADPRLAHLPAVMLTSIDETQEPGHGPPAGTLIRLAKPVRRADLARALALALGEDSAPVSAPPAEDRLRGRRLLLAEDNAVNQEVVRAMLADTGCELQIAADGEQALKLARETAFEVVLMDCQMPLMDGFEAVRRLRGAGRDFATARDVPVVALTANALAGDAERCRAAGFSDHLSKPVRREQMLQALSRWLGEAPATPSSAPTPAREPPPAQAPADDVLDPAAIARIREMQRRGAADLLVRLRTMFVDSAARLVASIEAALAEGDADALRHAAHTLKSASGNLGATALSRRCAELEAIARGAQFDQAAALWRVARLDYERALAALAELEPDAAPA